ncbi:hypothetical protein AeNC1_015313 [Aphanomyces euteiches]|nr:hypothetical protein AeNC1_015313 [Aphanomyces euteiches]
MPSAKHRILDEWELHTIDTQGNRRSPLMEFVSTDCFAACETASCSVGSFSVTTVWCSQFKSGYLATNSRFTLADPEAVKAYAQSFDILLCTSYGPTTNWDMLLSLVATLGTFVLVGLPEKPVSFAAFSVVPREITFAGGIIGSPSQIEEMLSFAVEKGVRSIVEVMDMSEASTALQKVHNGQARFRIVLKN